MPNLGLKKESISVEELPAAEIAVVWCRCLVPLSGDVVRCRCQVPLSGACCDRILLGG